MKGRVYKRGTSWYYRFDIEPDPLTGKRRQVNGSGYRTEREAWKVCRDAMADHERGRLVSSSRHKVGEALDEWLSRTEHSIKPSMVQNRAVRQAPRRGAGQGQAEEAVEHAGCPHASARQRRTGNALQAVQL